MKNGWKPGAISKRLLRIFNAGKLRDATSIKSKPAEKPKKDAKDKPTVLITKLDGRYCLEMQVRDGVSLKEYQPLKYSITSSSHDAQIKRNSEKRQRYSNKTALDGVSLDSQRSELDICRRSNRLDDQSENNLSFEEDFSSECSSIFYWELQYSPPNTRRR